MRLGGGSALGFKKGGLSGGACSLGWSPTASPRGRPSTLGAPQFGQTWGVGQVHMLGERLAGTFAQATRPSLRAFIYCPPPCTLLATLGPLPHLECVGL